ncbi:MAG: Calx-beta domain-containing protein [Candidatus Uhrbacteria bacterium GW2011_GWF2_41_430]|nr:MAG: Calx-beta domain-containing protein [Candidatus Uhrbacteria bacterium GW2011_GWF2_41_430]
MTGTASSPSDYSITASPLVITAGNASGSITITVVDDVVDELDETVIVTMGVLTNGIKGATDVHTATITDNDSAPTISIDDPTVSEGAGTGTVTVTLTGGSYLGVTVDYTTSTGTAIEGTDFTDATGTLTWAADETGTKTYSITITNDTLDENDKTITNTLSNPTNSTISDSTGTMTITDNDDAPTVAWTASSQSGAESVGTMTIIAQLSAVSGLDVTLPYTLTGTAVGTGTDYSITASQ